MKTEIIQELLNMESGKITPVPSMKQTQKAEKLATSENIDVNEILKGLAHYDVEIDLASLKNSISEKEKTKQHIKATFCSEKIPYVSEIENISDSNIVANFDNLHIHSLLKTMEKLLQTTYEHLKTINNAPKTIFLSRSAKLAIEKILSLSVQLAITADIDVQSLVNQILSKSVNSISENTMSDSSTGFCLNALGLPMHPLEIEVADMIKRAGKEETPFDEYEPYSRTKHGNPVSYLKKYYGKYLKKFGADNDYLYQFQLEKIDRAFKENLRSYLIYHGKKEDDEYYGQNINDFVPNISVKADKEADVVAELGVAGKVFANKVKNLTTTRINKHA